jgi:hypothetical protein
MRESRKETLDALGLEGGWRCVMDGGQLDTGVAKGLLSKELAVVGRVAVVSAVQHACFKLEEKECCRRRAALRCKRFYLCGWSLLTVYLIREKSISTENQTHYGSSTMGNHTFKFVNDHLHPLRTLLSLWSTTALGTSPTHRHGQNLKSLSSSTLL